MTKINNFSKTQVTSQTPDHFMDSSLLPKAIQNMLIRSHHHRCTIIKLQPHHPLVLSRPKNQLKVSS